MLTNEDLFYEVAKTGSMDWHQRQAHNALTFGDMNRVSQGGNMENETVKCKRCGNDTDILATFPGGVCLDCWAAKEGKQPLTQSDFDGMVNTFKGRKR